MLNENQPHEIIATAHESLELLNQLGSGFQEGKDEPEVHKYLENLDKIKFLLHENLEKYKSKQSNVNYLVLHRTLEMCSKQAPALLDSLKKKIEDQIKADSNIAVDSYD